MSITHKACNAFALLMLVALLAVALYGNAYMIFEGQYWNGSEINSLRLPPFLFSTVMTALSFVSISWPILGIVMRYWMLFSY